MSVLYITAWPKQDCNLCNSLDAIRPFSFANQPSTPDPFFVLAIATKAEHGLCGRRHCSSLGWPPNSTATTLCRTLWSRRQLGGFWRICSLSRTSFYNHLACWQRCHSQRPCWSDPTNRACCWSTVTSPRQSVFPPPRYAILLSWQTGPTKKSDVHRASNRGFLEQFC